MEKVLGVLVFCFSMFWNAIEAQQQITKDSLSISKYVKLNQVVQFGSI